MRTAGEAVANERVRRADGVRQHAVEHLAPAVAVAVAGGFREMAFRHAVFDERRQHLFLIVRADRVDAVKLLLRGVERAARRLLHPFIDREKLTHHVILFPLFFRIQTIDRRY